MHARKLAGILEGDGTEEQGWDHLLARFGWETVRLSSGQAGLEAARRHSVDLLLVDQAVLDQERTELLTSLKRQADYIPILVVAGDIIVSKVVLAMKLGAADYLEGPLQHEALGAALLGLNVAERSRAVASQPAGDVTAQMGNSPRIRQLALEIAQLGPSPYSALIIGETGTGKELVAQAIHQTSPRRDMTFLALDCGAIPESLMESELFGHEKGAFTGADRVTVGKFEAAEGGTLFLDEISSLPLSMQNRLLRVLQERRFYRVGGTRLLTLDCRVIAASSQPSIASGRDGFRADLYHRLGEYVIHLPPLRERREDIPFLVGQFIRQANHELNRQVAGVSPETIRLFTAHDWPGNVRELRNVIRRGVLWAPDWGYIEPQHLGAEWQGGRFDAHGTGPVLESCARPLEDSVDPSLSLRELVRTSRVRIESKAIVQWLNRTQGNVAEVARRLDADYKTIHSKIREYGIELHIRAGHVVATCPEANPAPPELSP